MVTSWLAKRRAYFRSLEPRIRELAAQDKTATEIAAELCVTRQAIGKFCRRLGIKHKTRPWTPHKERSNRAAIEPGASPRAEQRFSEAMGGRSFDRTREQPGPIWRRSPPVTIVIGSSSSIGGRYG